MTGHNSGHYMLSKRENIKGNFLIELFLTLLKYHSCVLRCMALYRDACKVKDMCLRYRKIGYKGLKDTSDIQLLFCLWVHSFNFPYHWFNKIKLYITKSLCMHMWFSQIYVSFTSTEIQGAPLCKQMNTFRSKTNNQWTNGQNKSWFLVNGRTNPADLMTAPHIYLMLTFKVCPVNKGNMPLQRERQSFNVNDVLFCCCVVCMKYTWKQP